MKILVISDLHVGEGAICTDLSTGSGQNAIKQNFLKELHQLTIDENISADLLVITGDITNRARKEEFLLASQRILEIAKYFKITDINKIFFVPGNHDSNWEDEERVLSSDASNITEAIDEKYKNIKTEFLLKSVLDSSQYGCFYSEPYFVIWQLEFANIIGINTSVFDHHNKKPHHGVLRLSDIKILDKKLEELNIKDSGKLNLVMLHHHPVQQPDIPFTEADHSILQNSSSFMDVCYKNKINLIIHGHKHIPTLSNKMDDYFHPITVLCSGSFSARLDDRYFQGVPNMIHLVEIDDKCPINKTVKGSVKSWEHNTGHGWQRDKSRNGIGYKEYFGNTMPPLMIKEKIKEQIELLFSTQTHITWSDLSKNYSEILYTPRKLLNQILIELQRDLLFKRLDTPSDDELFILLKGE